MTFLKFFKSLFGGGALNINDRFIRLREVETGSMSRFFVARDLDSQKTVGLKIVNRDKQANAARVMRSRSLEGEVGMLLNHPNIAKTYESGMTHSGDMYLVTEFIDGSALSNLIQQHVPQLKLNRLSLVRQMAEAVGAVHKAGYIHRDVCPRNFICSPDATSVKLIDFGLTVAIAQRYMNTVNRTGTPQFMAPEIARFRGADHRADIFSLGVSAYQLCAFELPWVANGSHGSVAMLHDTVPPTPLTTHCPEINPDLAQAIMRCLTPAKEGRPESIDAFLEMIQDVPDPSLKPTASSGCYI